MAQDIDSAMEEELAWMSGVGIDGSAAPSIRFECSYVVKKAPAMMQSA
jgi:hypothetical protein